MHEKKKNNQEIKSAGICLRKHPTCCIVLCTERRTWSQNRKFKGSKSFIKTLSTSTRSVVLCHVGKRLGTDCWCFSDVCFVLSFVSFAVNNLVGQSNFNLYIATRTRESKRDNRTENWKSKCGRSLFTSGIRKNKKSFGNIPTYLHLTQARDWVRSSSTSKQTCRLSNKQSRSYRQTRTTPTVGNTRTRKGKKYKLATSL